MKEIELTYADKENALRVSALKSKIVNSNNEYDRINKILAENNMHLCQNAIFENDYPFRYVGFSKDYQLYIKIV